MSLVGQPQFFRIQAIPVVIEGSHPDIPLYRGLRSRLLDKLSRFRNQNMWKVSLTELESLAREEQWVSHVRVRRFLPNSLQVEIVPKQIVALYVGTNGRVKPLASDGQFMGSLRVTEAPDAPIIRNEIFEKDKDLREKLVGVLEQLPQNSLLRSENIEEVEFDPRRGFHLLLLNPSIRVILGFDDIKTKVQRVNRVFDYLETNSIQSRVIDAVFPKKVLVRLRKGS